QVSHSCNNVIVEFFRNLPQIHMARALYLDRGSDTEPVPEIIVAIEVAVADWPHFSSTLGHWERCDSVSEIPVVAVRRKFTIAARKRCDHLVFSVMALLCVAIIVSAICSESVWMVIAEVALFVMIEAFIWRYRCPYCNPSLATLKSLAESIRT
ncbi:hypothetical protein PFISCL1PPCAC_9127, partial [Pristionchus fissidentatus]